MIVLRFDKIEAELISNMRRDMLIPIIGSGFTRGCSSFNGSVPSGKDYLQYMISRINDCLPLSDSDERALRNDTFSNISSIYQRTVPPDTQEKYLRDHFTKVTLDESKRQFLSLPWPYIYTLNIDDGIEKGSEYNHVVYANRRVNERVFDDEKCVIKLHGDITDMLTYLDSKSEVFSQEQYIASLKENTALLSKLNHDSNFQNLLFVGCSLDDEIDLLFSLVKIENKGNQSARYICVTKEPSPLEKLKYEKYGITHCIVFDSFGDIYSKLYSIGIEAQKISLDDLDGYKKFSFKRLSSDYGENKPYFLFGKSLIDKDHTISIPYFFISREESETIIRNLSKYNLQLLVGSRCSGKSYILIDIICKIRDRDIFYFETKDRLSDLAFEKLLSKKNCVVLADSAALSNRQFEILLNKLDILKRNKISVVIVTNKNNRDLNGILKLYELEGKIDPTTIPQISVSSVFSATELEQLNPLLTAVNVGIFSSKTIVDNIIELSERLREKNKYRSIAPRFQTVQNLAALIALGTEQKVYSAQATKLNLIEAFLVQCRAAEPLIDCESTWSFEKSHGDSSPTKYVLNAEYWLYNQLETFARVTQHRKIIIDAYKYIITNIIALTGGLDLLHNNGQDSYKEYILFDNINRLFSFKHFGQNGLELIRVIYDGLNDLLSVDPNYMHQRAKCYIKSSYYEKEPKLKIAYLDKAYRDANVAFLIFDHRYDEFENEKLTISIDHVTYTQALILCHKCSVDEYKNIDANSEAIETLYRALSSPYNTYSFAKTDSFNYQNVIKKIISTTITDKKLVHPEVYFYLQELFKIVSENE